tara:strand:+ start:2336 stop:2485 length:150 start_codon:yes stop_codon:yes gene_type:complete
MNKIGKYKVGGTGIAVLVGVGLLLAEYEGLGEDILGAILIFLGLIFSRV